MKKILVLLLSTFLLSGCGSSIEGALGKCEKVGEVSRNVSEFKVCLKVDSSTLYFSSGKYFDKALFLGQLAIFNLSVVEKGDWFESFRDEIDFNSSTDSQYIDALWSASNAKDSIEEITAGEPRWDALIASITNYVEAKEVWEKATKNYFELGPSNPESSKAFKETNEASERFSSEIKNELVEELSIFLSYLRSETGLSNSKAARLTLDYLNR